MKLKQLLLEKREEIIRIAAKHGVYNIRIFGSVARGEDDEKSDIDLIHIRDCLARINDSLHW